MKRKRRRKKVFKKYKNLKRIEDIVHRGRTRIAILVSERHSQPIEKRTGKLTWAVGRDEGARGTRPFQRPILV
jgi:hypothetical protein